MNVPSINKLMSGQSDMTDNGSNFVTLFQVSDLLDVEILDNKLCLCIDINTHILVCVLAFNI